MGAVADFSSLVVAVRHGGVSIAEVTGQVITRRARMLFSVFILIALVLVLAVFAVLTAGTFVQAPEIVVPSWGILPVAALAGFVALPGPHRRRAADPGHRPRPRGDRRAAGPRPRLPPAGAGDRRASRPRRSGSCCSWPTASWPRSCRSSTCSSRATTSPRTCSSPPSASASSGSWSPGRRFQAAPFHGFQPVDWPLAGPLWPLMFVTIACGAISGFHSVVSSGTTCKQLDNEAHACRIGYGAMIMESVGGHAGGDRGGRGPQRAAARRAAAGPRAGPSPPSARATARSPARCSGATGRPSPSWRSTSSSSRPSTPPPASAATSWRSSPAGRTATSRPWSSWRPRAPSPSPASGACSGRPSARRTSWWRRWRCWSSRAGWWTGARRAA